MNGVASHSNDVPLPPPPPTNEAPPPPPSNIAAPPPPPSASLPPPPPPPSESAPPPSLRIPNGAAPNDLNDNPPPSIKPNPLKRKVESAPKRQPLSIEEILRKKKEADEAAAKPKFLSKAQREKLALEKRQKEAEEQRRRIDTERAGRLEGLASNGDSAAEPGYSTSNGVNGHSALPAIPTGPRALRRGENGTRDAHRDNVPNKGYDMQPPPPPKAVAVTGPGSTASDNRKKLSEEEAAAALTRQRYMGADQQSTFSAKKKRKRTTEKKFNFEWNAEEDTSNDYNPLYQQRVEANFFGRGRLGGLAEETLDGGMTKYARALEERDGEAGRQRAREMLEMGRRRREEGRGALEKHWSEKPLTAMRERDWRIFKEDFNIATKGGNIPNPMRNWSESGLPQRILDTVAAVGYAEPSAVQRAAIPIALQNRDLIAVAVTGSGKTASFLLPLLVYISALPPLNEFTKNDGPYAIILAPTRELAQQIEIEAKKFATPLGFTCVSIVGGHSIEEQAYNMRDGAEIIIATPGRLVDCIERRVLVLGQCCYIIMDEADRMIDLGFEEPVNKILDALPVSNEKPDTDDAENSAIMTSAIGVGGGALAKYRQTMMYTATMPSAVERIARKYLRRPAIVTIGNVGEAVETVEQRVEFISGEDKRKKRLQELLSMRHEYPPPIIVFVNIKRNADAVARDVKHMGFNAVTLHGSKTQDQREASLGALRRGEADVLVATDLAGRGIDVPDVSLVINFNMATNIESYTHRIGRTGRAGKSGVAITFLGNEDEDVMYDLKQMLSKSSISRVPEELRRHPAAQQKTVKGGLNKGDKKIEEGGGFGGKNGAGW